MELLWRRHRSLVLIASALMAIAAATAIVWPITDLIAAHDVGAVVDAQRAQQLQTAREAVRTQLLTLGAGVFAAGALVFTARNSIFAQRTVQLTEQGQVTDRYTKAIEQLGSDKLDVRLGGIYALERVALDSPRDHLTVIEVLAAFIREHSREQWPLPAPGDAAVPERITRPDVQAALTVIGRRDTTQDRQRIDLAGANLTRAKMPGASATLKGIVSSEDRANFTGADLTGAVLIGANLTGADLNPWLVEKRVGRRLIKTSSSFALLINANLTHAILIGANLTHAILTDADLTHAILTGADLTHAILTGANLTGADLTGADLTRADLTRADLTGAKFDGEAPEGWVRDPATGRLQHGDEQQQRPNAGVDGPASYSV